jgi:hypothetical protein
MTCPLLHSNSPDLGGRPIAGYSMPIPAILQAKTLPSVPNGGNGPRLKFKRLTPDRRQIA